MRSDVYNPNQQICYEQRHGHDTGIMIEVRTPELTYENRFEKHTMKVLSSSESNDILDKMGIKQQENNVDSVDNDDVDGCLLYTSPSPRDKRQSRMPSSA